MPAEKDATEKNDVVLSYLDKFVRIPVHPICPMKGFGIPTPSAQEKLPAAAQVACRMQPRPVTVDGMHVRNLKMLTCRSQIKLPTTSRSAFDIEEATIRRSGNEFLEAALRKRLRTSVLLATH